MPTFPSSFFESYTMTPAHPQIHRRHELALPAQQPNGAKHLEAVATELQRQVDALLQQFSNHEIALCLQRSHNALPDHQREGYRMEIRLLSLSYQQGGYDALY